MQETTIEIKVLKQDIAIPVDPSTVDNLIFQENSPNFYSISQIVLRYTNNRVRFRLSDPHRS